MEGTRILAFAGTFIPVAGGLLTIGLALLLAGRARWVALVVVPAVTALACWLAAPAVFYDGNLLAAVFYLGYAVLLMAYYPILGTVMLVQWARRRARAGASARP